MMTARVRLFAAVVLFVSWVSLLGYLAVTAGRPIVLSRPQLLVATNVVVAELDGEDHPKTSITTLMLPSGWSAAKKESDNLAPVPFSVENLELVGPAQGWHGPGQYILPLTRLPDGKVRLTPIPPSPGYPANDLTHDLRIYPVTPDTLRQLGLMRPGK